MKRFIGADREQRILMPYDLGDWLPEDHLARFVVDVVDKLDMKGIYKENSNKSMAKKSPRQ